MRVDEQKVLRVGKTRVTLDSLIEAFRRGETPEEIALAIVSEVAAVLANRCGGSLRDRTIDIHATNVAAAGGEAA